MGFLQELRPWKFFPLLLTNNCCQERYQKEKHFSSVLFRFHLAHQNKQNLLSTSKCRGKFEIREIKCATFSWHDFGHFAFITKQYLCRTTTIFFMHFITHKKSTPTPN